MSGAGQRSSGELRSEFTSTTGGVMTEEAGAIAGELELLTHLTPDGKAVEALVRYAGAEDLYTVSENPVRATSGRPDGPEHRAAHERILDALTTPGPAAHGNEGSVSLLD